MVRKDSILVNKFDLLVYMDYEILVSYFIVLACNCFKIVLLIY